MPTAYDYSPAGRRGQGAYGLVPGNIQAPDPFADLSQVYPNLSGTNAQVSRNVMSQLRGELSPETIAALQDDAAKFGVTSGMPGSQLAGRRGLRNLGLNVENVQNQGAQNFISTTGAIRQNQILDPALKAAIAERNATLNSAPDPEMAANQLQATFNNNRNGFGPAGGGAGGVRYSGGAPSRPQPLMAEPDFSYNGPTRGTGYEDRPYLGDYINPIPKGYTAGGSGNYLDFSGGAAQPFDPFFGGYLPGQNIDFGAGYGDEASPVYGQNQYDPAYDYGQGGGAGIDYGYE